MKTALAPTIELATPKVEKYIAKKLLPFFGILAKLKEFYACSPPTSDVENHQGERWVEGNWGVKIISDSFSLSYMHDLAQLSKIIQINEVSIHSTADRRLEIVLWLSARIMR